MSNRFSTSPALHLTLDEHRFAYRAGQGFRLQRAPGRQHRIASWQLLLWCCHFIVILLCVLFLLNEGYPGVFAIYGILSLVCMAHHQLHRDALTALQWSGGRWQLQVNGRWIDVAPQPACFALHRMLSASFQPMNGSRPYRIWLIDGGGLEREIKRLRARLRLEGCLH